MAFGDIIALGFVALGLPWLVLHYITRWKTASSLSASDEVLLDELFQLARRLEARMATVERLVAADHPDFHPASATTDSDPIHSAPGDAFARNASERPH